MAGIRPRQQLVLAAVLDAFGVVVLATALDQWRRPSLLAAPGWLLAFTAAYLLFGWLFGSYTLLRWPWLRPKLLALRLGLTALATLLVVILVDWFFNLPVGLTITHRSSQLLLLVSLSGWALAVRLWLRRLTGQVTPPFGCTPLQRVEWQQQRLPPSLLPGDWLDRSEIPWSDPFSIQRQLKRTADVALALTLLLLSLPLLLLAALLIWLEDRGPVFYVQERSGFDGAPFRLIKLRTMVPQHCDTPPTWTQVGDRRVTRVGALLRRVRLDELPQLLNVLRGEMSLIGPRPERPELEHELEARIPHYRKRHWMLPGLSGWAQVCAPYAASVEEAELKLSYDLYYLQRWNVGLDLLILAKTIKTVLKARGR